MLNERSNNKSKLLEIVLLGSGKIVPLFSAFSIIIKLLFMYEDQS